MHVDTAKFIVIQFSPNNVFLSSWRLDLVSGH